MDHTVHGVAKSQIWLSNFHFTSLHMIRSPLKILPFPTPELIVYLERPSTSTQADLLAFSFSIAKLSSCCLAAKSCLTLLQNQVVKCFYLLMKNKSLVTTYRICVQFRWQEACKAFCTWTYSTKWISAAVTGAQLSLGIWGESIPAPQRQQNLRILKSLI